MHVYCSELESKIEAGVRLVEEKKVRRLCFRDG